MIFLPQVRGLPYGSANNRLNLRRKRRYIYAIWRFSGLSFLLMLPRSLSGGRSVGLFDSSLRAGGLVLLFLLALSWHPPSTTAQELLCDVSVDFSQVSGSDYDYLEGLERLTREYVNDRRWTEDQFEDQERILCSFDVIIEEATALTEFRARLVVSSVRPIYGTMQNTRVMQVSDREWEFAYAQGAALTFDLDTFDAYTSVIDFYAYLVLGYDYDTFSPMGGTPHFERARRIARLGESANAEGWSSIGTARTRTDLVTQLLDGRLEPLRRAYFTYHYRGLDHFVQEPEEARRAALDVLSALDELASDVSRQYALDLFFNTKSRELAALFTGAPNDNQAYAILSRVDPSNLSDYNPLVE